MRLLRIVGAMAVASPLTLLVAAPAAGAVDDTCKTVVSTLTDRPDSGTAGTWATDAMTRTVEICETDEAHNDNLAIYTAKLTDEGTFVTLEGDSLSPGGGQPLKGGVPGTLTGSAEYKFAAAPGFTTFDASHLDGKTLSGAPGGDNPTTGDWVKSMFSDYVGYNEVFNNSWSWTYKSCAGETWTNQAKELGGNSGDITGSEPCPEPAPSPEPKPSPDKDGDELAATGTDVTTFAYAGVALVLLGAVAVLIASRRRRATQ